MYVEFNWSDENFYTGAQSCAQNPMTPFILEFLPKNEPLLEAGCGSGNFVRFLSDLNYDVYGIEINESAVKMIKKLDPSLKVTQGNTEDILYPDNFFGGITSFGVIEHISTGPEKALSEIYRVLKPGGTALISVPIFNSMRFLKYYSGLSFIDDWFRKIYHDRKNKIDWLHVNQHITLRHEFQKFPVTNGFFEYRFSQKQMNAMLKEAGFIIEKEIPLEGLGGLYHELSGKIVDLSNPNLIIKSLDRIFSYIPFFHHHTYLAIVKKPNL